MERIVYRVGDLDKYKRKADSLYAMNGRGSGYFGTGYYFCTKPEKCISITRENDPLYELKLKDDLKFLRGTPDLHEGLKTFTKYVYNFPMLMDDAYLECHLSFARAVQDYIVDVADCDAGTRIKRDYELWSTDGVTWKEYYHSSFDLRNLAVVAAKTELSEITDILRSESPNFDRIDEIQRNHQRLFDYEDLKNLKRLKFKATEILAIDLHTTQEKIESIVKDFYEIYKDFYKDDFFRVDVSMTEEDSASTFLLKSLGYDGVWPSPECDNTYYGGVVFDLENFTFRKLADRAKDWEGLKD